jgi:ribokinase
MPRKPRICVVGSANVDLTFRTPRLPRPGETMAARSFHVGMGGKGANQAVAAARLGADVCFAARVGADSFGQEALHCYAKDAIDTRFIQRDAKEPTGTAAIVVDDNAENSIVIASGANAALSVADVRTAAPAITASDLLLCQLETPIDATMEAFRMARAANVRTVLTPAPATTLPDELLQLCDLCVPNQSELEILTGKPIETLRDAEDAARGLRERGARIVVVTLGRLGGLVVDAGEALHVPAIKVEAIDPTGAGDAFTAALAVYLAKGHSLRAAAELATVVAGLAVTRIGAQAAFPTIADVDAWLGKS